MDQCRHATTTNSHYNTAKHLQRTRSQTRDQGGDFILTNDLAAIVISSFRNDKQADFDDHNPIEDSNTTAEELLANCHQREKAQKLSSGETKLRERENATEAVRQACDKQTARLRRPQSV